MAIVIETATTKLLDRLYEIEKQSFQKEAFTKQQIGYLLADYSTISLVARVNDEIVGFAIGTIDVAGGRLCGHVLTLETLPSYRRKGVAMKLLGELESLFRERGVAESRLEVREDNSAAIRLYKKFGYKVTDRLRGYYGNVHGLYLTKPILRRQG